MITLYPYELLGGGIRLKVTSVYLDGVELENGLMDPSFRLVDLYRVADGDPTWQIARLELAVETPAASDDATDDLRITCIAQSPATSMRQSCPMRRSLTDGLSWTCTMELGRENFAEHVTLSAVASYADNARGRTFKGESDTWKIHIYEPAIPNIEGFLSVRWEDFQSPDMPDVIRQHQAQPFFVDLQSSAPVLYLNSRIDGLSELMDETHPRGSTASALQTLECLSIARSAWMAMVTASAVSIEVDEDSEASMPHADWQKAVLEAVIDDIYPETARSDALARAHADVNSLDGVRAFTSRAQLAVDRQLAATGRLKKAISALDRSNR